MPPQGGDHPTRQAPIGTGQFQSTPPHGRRRRVVGVGQCLVLFQSTPPHGRRHSGLGCSPTVRAGFNPRLRTGGDKAALYCRPQRTGFNPRLRTGGDRARRRISPKKQTVSIHASAREATNSKAHFAAVWGVSIHASAREATGLTIALLAVSRVSIHASAREAMPTRSPVAVICLGFNPRLRTGGDIRPMCGSMKQRGFQSTPPHGRRPCNGECPKPRNGFQSTPPHGRRQYTLASAEGEFAFQSTPPHGRRLGTVASGPPHQVFQSTPPHGRRRPAVF